MDRPQFRPLRAARKVESPPSNLLDSPPVLQSITNHYTPSISLSTPSKRSSVQQITQQLLNNSTYTNSSASTPRIRSKLTPLALVTPRKPVLERVTALSTPIASTSKQSAYSHTPAQRSVDKSATDQSVLVCVRVRPAAAKLVSTSSANLDDESWDIDEANATLRLRRTENDYAFDSVVTGSDNRAVYDVAGKNLVIAAMEGVSALVFAYGQTNSGKTFTLTGNAANPGITPQSVEEIFAYIQCHPERDFLLRASYLEIYNESLRDLLAPDSPPLRVRQDENKMFFVGSREEVVVSVAQVTSLLKRGDVNRSTGATEFNERSSRSHSVFQITIESKDSNGEVRMSRLSLIDLAGSEKASGSGGPERRIEGAFINKSLLTLEQVIRSLTEQRAHVPYRDSKLTQLLQPALSSGSSLVSVIATINPAKGDAVIETTSTLKFAQRLKKVVLKPVFNGIVSDKTLISQYLQQIAQLEAQLAQASTIASPPRSVDSRESERETERLKTELLDLQALFVNSSNFEDRRKSVAPPRAVSPLKLGAKGGDSVGERLQETVDSLTEAEEKVNELQSRIFQLEDEVIGLKSDSSTPKSTADLIDGLKKENQELKVIATELSSQEKQWERASIKFQATQDMLIASLEQERSKNKKFEHYIIRHLSNVPPLPRPTANFGSHLVPQSLPRSSTIRDISHSSYLSPLASESLELFDTAELNEKDFSNESQARMIRSGSRLFY